MNVSRKPVGRAIASKWVADREFAWKLEEQSLDKIHHALGQNPDGLKLSDLAVLTGIGRGYLEQLLKGSECVLKLIPGSYRWTADWGDVPDSYRPTSWRVQSRA